MTKLPHMTGHVDVGLVDNIDKCFSVFEAVGVKAEQFVYLPWKFSISIVDGPPIKAVHAVLIKPRRGGEQA